MSLVADYGDSDQSEDSTDSEPEDFTSHNVRSEPKDNPQEKLPTPDFLLTSSSKTSVFSNPYKDAENAKQAILEKHVKMVNAQENVKIINGKKICWNYRKGRCRFGHNCIYAHDSDLQKSKEQLDAENQVQETVLCEEQVLPQPTEQELQQIRDVVKGEKRKRPGLTQGLIPGKRVVKNYQKGKANTVKR